MVAKSKKPKFQNSAPTKSELLFKVGKDVPKWYSIESSPASSSSKSINEKYDKQKCEQIYRTECDLYQNLYQQDQSSDYQWLQTSLSTTSKDRLAALVTLIRRSPVHSIKELENLVNLLRSNIQHRRDALTIAEILQDVFVNTYLPENRRLLSMNQQPNTKQAAAIAFFEETIKQLYSNFIDLLQQIAHDPIGPIRIKAVSMLERLLSQRPEQEKRLLELIVDKLGDPDSNVAAKTLHLLTQLLEQHPGMKTVVVNEIERLLFRQNIRQSAQHYGLCCLTSITFTSQDNDLANKLIKIYFALFRLLSVKEDVSSKFFAILLGGVTRAISFAKVDLDNIIEHLNDLFRIVHSTNFKTSVRALQLLFRIAEQRPEIDDRYYNTLYSKLSEPEWKNSKMLSTFLNLIFKSLLKDSMESRIRGFIKRLFQLCLFNDVPFICGILLLISELVQRHVNGARLLLFSQKPNHLSAKNDKTRTEDDDEEEHFHDVGVEDDQALQMVPEVSSWDHKILNKSNQNYANHYDIFKRNPLYCGSEYTCLHEIILLKNHSHPTVALFAQHLFDEKPIDYNGNPLIDFNSMRFFDRFVYKNPKKQIAKHEILRKKTRHAAGRLYLPKGVKAVPVDSNEYTRLNSAHIPADERFLYTFMKMRQENNELAQEKKKQKPSDDDDIDDNESIESVSDDEFDKYLDHFMDDIDKDEIDLDDDDDNNSVEDIASTVQRVQHNDEPTNDDDDDMDNRPFTLNDGDELSDDEQLDDHEGEPIRNQHIHENYKVDNEREMKQIKWELDRERTFANRSRRYDKHMKKTSRRKPKLTRREKRRQMNQTNIPKKKKRVHFS